MKAESRESVEVCRRCRGRAEMITLPREEAEIDVFGSGFMCILVLGRLWGEKIKDISPLGLCLLLHHQQFLQERLLLVLQSPDRTAETFFSKNCFSQHSHHWCCLITGKYLIS